MSKIQKNFQSYLTCQGIRDGQLCGIDILVDAHIIPQAFARRIQRIRKGHHNVQVTPNGMRRAKQQMGPFDPGLLCATCDQVLGHLDDYAVRVIDRIPADLIVAGELWGLPNVDGDKFAKFVLAVLWRASLSKLPDFAKFSLGAYDEQARRVLFEGAPLSSLPEFEVILARFRSSTRTHLMFSIPVAVQFSGRQGFGFLLAGFEFYVKMDKTPFSKELAPFVVNGATLLRGIFKPFEGSGAEQTLRAAIVSEAARGKSQKRK